MNNVGIVIAAIAIIIVVGVGYYLLSSGHSGYTTTVASTSVHAVVASTSVAPTTSTRQNSTGPSTTMASTTTAASTTIAAAYTIELENSSSLGTYLANASGFTLYTYSGDTPNSGTSACTGSCASSWPPFYTATLVLPPGLNASSFKTIMNGESKQLTYNGMPLYLFVGDSAAGQTNGNNLGGFKVATK
jgi:predicted lipoprotein with Yx(FWY)xxD motif